MENYFSYFQIFQIPLANYNESGECVVDKAQKRHYSFKCPHCKMIAFLGFEVTAYKSVKKMAICCQMYM